MAMLVLVITLCLITLEIVEAGKCAPAGKCMISGCKYTSECCLYCRKR